MFSDFWGGLTTYSCSYFLEYTPEIWKIQQWTRGNIWLLTALGWK